MANQLITLLQAVAQNRLDVKLASFGEAQIRWAIAIGLGPLLFQAIKADTQASGSPFWPLLRGADLAARVLTAEHIDAMIEIVDGLKGQVETLTLLKGISICDQHYPKPHLRPMRDIDFLVEDGDLARVDSLLFKLGYRQRFKNLREFYQGHHHGMPWFHPQRGVWVEVHRALFPAKSPLGADARFRPESLRRQLTTSEFHGRPVKRFSDELQLLYIASHWGSDFQAVGGAVAILDVIYLFKNTQDVLNWRAIMDAYEGSVAFTYLYLLLTYLVKYGLIDVAPDVYTDLCLRRRSFGYVNLKIIHALIDKFLLTGRRGSWEQFRFRNASIAWKTLSASTSPLRNLLLIPRNLLLPYHLREKLQ
jgi:Uncharacterised nucleotidyltransferase